jgi:hypothetical protein
MPLSSPADRSRRAASLAAALLLSAAAAGAQTSRADPSDVQGWYQLGVDLDLPKKWEASAEYRLRTVDNASDYHGSYLTGEIGRELFRRVSLFANYRYADVEAEVTHRLGIGAKVSRKLWGTTVSFRPQVQHRLQGGDDEQGTDAKTMVRTRLKLAHPLTRSIGLYASTEPYFDPTAGYALDNWRNTVGTKWEYAKGKTVDQFYIYRPDYAKSYDRTFHVVGMSLGFDVKMSGKNE